MTAAPMPRPQTLAQALAWRLALRLLQRHVALCQGHLFKAEAMKARRPWPTGAAEQGIPLRPEQTRA